MGCLSPTSVVLAKRERWSLLLYGSAEASAQRGPAPAGAAGPDVRVSCAFGAVLSTPGDISGVGDARTETFGFTFTRCLDNLLDAYCVQL